MGSIYCSNHRVSTKRHGSSYRWYSKICNFSNHNNTNYAIRNALNNRIRIYRIYNLRFGYWDRSLRIVFFNLINITIINLKQSLLVSNYNTREGFCQVLPAVCHNDLPVLCFHDVVYELKKEIC